MKMYNISIIVLDTLRLDTFNELRKIKGLELSRFGNFMRFEKCIAPETWTLPSTASILTGTYASEHGAHETKDIKWLDIEKIKLKSKTLVSDLKGLGYKTYAISANPYFHPIYGFDEFDSFKEEPYFTDVYGMVVDASKKAKLAAAKYRNIYGSDLLKISVSMFKEDPNLFFEAVASSVILTPIAAMKKLKAKFIDGWPVEKGGKRMVATEKKSRLREPFFLFVDFMEPHDPYVGSKDKDFDFGTSFMKKKFDMKLLDLWKRLYYKASLKCYKYALEIVNDLVKRFGKDQIIILTSDHGQAFNEHGFVGHGAVLYDEVARVPLAIMLPEGFEEVKSNDYVSLVNLRAFISAALQGDRKAIRKLYSKEVKSESFAIPANISFIKGVDIKKMLKSERLRIRIFRS
jgi:arylsulfatase A-like enzyme